MGWVWPLLRLRREEISEKCGNEAMIYLHFQRVIIVFWAICTFFGMVIVLPVNVTGSGDLESFFATTIGNVKRQDKYWAHTFMCVFFSLMTYTLVFYLRSFLLHTKDMFQRRSVKSAVSAHSIIIRNFPANFVDDTVIKDHFESLIENNDQLKATVRKLKVKKRTRRRRSVSKEKNARNEEVIKVEEGDEEKIEGTLKWDRNEGVYFIDESHTEHEHVLDEEQGESERRLVFEEPQVNGRDKGKERDSSDSEWEQNDEDNGSTSLSTMSDNNHNHNNNSHQENGISDKKSIADTLQLENMVIHESNGISNGIPAEEGNDDGDEDEKESPVVAVHVAYEISELISEIESYNDSKQKLEHFRNLRDTTGQRPQLWIPPSAGKLR